MKNWKGKEDKKRKKTVTLLVETLLCLTHSDELQLPVLQLQKQIQPATTLTTTDRIWSSPAQHERKTCFKPFWVSLVPSHVSVLPQFLFPAGAARDGGRHLPMHLGRIVESTINQHHEIPRSQGLEPTAHSGHLESPRIPGDAARRGFAQSSLLFGGLQHFGKLPELFGHRMMLEHT